MTFPPDFPEHVIARFEYERRKLEKKLKRANAAPWPVPKKLKDDTVDPGTWDLLRFHEDYICCLMPTLWKGLCAHGKQNPHDWPARRISSVIYKLPRKLKTEVYIEKSRHLRELADSLPSLKENIISLENTVKKLLSPPDEPMRWESPKWESPEFENALRSVAKVQARMMKPRRTAATAIDPQRKPEHLKHLQLGIGVQGAFVPELRKSSRAPSKVALLSRKWISGWKTGPLA